MNSIMATTPEKPINNGNSSAGETDAQENRDKTSFSNVKKLWDKLGLDSSILKTMFKYARWSICALQSVEANLFC